MNTGYEFDVPERLREGHYSAIVRPDQAVWRLNFTTWRLLYGWDLGGWVVPMAFFWSHDPNAPWGKLAAPFIPAANSRLPLRRHIEVWIDSARWLIHDRLFGDLHDGEDW